MARAARIRYYDSVRLGDDTIATAGTMVILNTQDTPEQCRHNGYPVWSIVWIQGTSATGPMLRLEPVHARGRSAYMPEHMREVEPRTMRLVRPEDQVEVL